MNEDVFSKRFHSLRTERSMNQELFAEFVGISRPTVGFYENGDRVPDIRILKLICEKCGVSADWLIGVDGATKSTPAGDQRNLELLSKEKTVREACAKLKALSRELDTAFGIFGEA